MTVVASPEGVHITGLPGTLPPGERILWQARPHWRSLAVNLCHIRPVALYLAVVLAGATAASVAQGATAAETAFTVAPFLAAAAAALAILLAIAWLVARTTEYTLTSQRLVMRFGIALHATLAIPHRGIAHAAVALHKDGTGDLPLRTKPGYHVALRRIWPHARPWHLRRPEPMLRSVPDAGAVAALLAQTLAAAEPVSPPSAEPAPRRIPERSLTAA